MAPSAQDAFDAAGEGESVIGWKLKRAQRRALLSAFPPTYRNTIADHVTLRTGAASDAPLPQENEAEVIGRADDGRGVEALAVRLGGTSERPDGGTYHITWSLEDGREARESNDVLAGQGWVALDEPVPIRLQPARWP
jgi:hypothetical protein